jgi:membrane protease subunit HflK
MSAPLDQLTSGQLAAPTAIPATPAGASPLPPEPSLTPEEAGSQALSDALKSSFAIVKFVMVLLVVVFFASGIFTVPSQKRAIVLRFGKPVGAVGQQLLGPGLHWSFPYPIDEVVQIPTSQIQSVTSTTGWYFVDPKDVDDPNAQAQTVSLNPATDGYTLTSDGNIIHVKATLRYRIDDPLNYTLNFVNASNTLQNALDNALIHASANFTVDQVLKTEAQAFNEKIVDRVRQLVEQEKLGVSIETAQVYPIAPRQVRKDFEDVFVADNNARKLLEEAQGYARSNEVTAAADAKVIINDAMTERAQLVQAVASEAKYFTNQLPYYRSDPNLLMARLQTEAIGNTLTNAQNKILRMDPEKSMWIQASRPPEKPPPQPER